MVPSPAGAATRPYSRCRCLAGGDNPVRALRSAIDRYALAGDIAGPRPDEEGDHAGDILRPAHPAERGCGVEGRHVRDAMDGAGHPSPHLRIHESGCHDVDPDSVT